MKLHKFKYFVNELVTHRSEFSRSDKVDPALMTFQEYFNEMQKGALHPYHNDSAYNYTSDDDAYSWFDIKNSKWKRIKTKRYDNIIIEFYQNQEELSYYKRNEDDYDRDEKGELIKLDNAELNKKGKITKDYSIIAYHRDQDLAVGAAQNEWGSVLISVLKEYRGLGIADDLEDMYRYYFPERGTGGVTNSGYNMLKRYHARLVKKYLANGIYSDMVRNGEITSKRVKEIVNSIDKKKYVYKGTDFSKKYGGSGEYMYLIDDSCVIIFDISIKEALKRSEPERFTKKLLKCFIYINQFKNDVDYENLFTVYAEDDKYMKIGIDVLLSAGIKISDYFLKKRFDKKTVELINKVFISSDYKLKTEKHYEHDNMVRVISLKKKKYNFEQMKRDSNLWFNKFDKYEEFKNHLIEFAEGVADIN